MQTVNKWKKAVGSLPSIIKRLKYADIIEKRNGRQCIYW